MLEVFSDVLLQFAGRQYCSLDTLIISEQTKQISVCHLQLSLEVNDQFYSLFLLGTKLLIIWLTFMLPVLLRVIFEISKYLIFVKHRTAKLLPTIGLMKSTISRYMAISEGIFRRRTHHDSMSHCFPPCQTCLHIQLLP